MSPAETKPAKIWSVHWQPPRIVNGSPIVFEVSPPFELKRLTATWLRYDIQFSFDKAKRVWYGLAGVSLDTPPGAYTLALNGTTAAGKDVAFQKMVKTSAGHYPTISIKVPTKFTEPNPEQQKQIAADKVTKDQAFNRPPSEKEWSGKFLAPVKSTVTDVFGTRRTLNGKTQTTHQGLDFAAGPGTPVHAVNRGTVILAQPLYFEGNCVVIDHGGGLLTLYMHLSELRVKEEEQVTRGQEVGLSGGTGRATGPHLHLAVRWQGTYLNPETLLRFELPAAP